MRNKLIYLTTFVLVLGLVSPSTVFGGILVERTIAEGSDDAEELVYGEPGAMELDSGDLELVYEEEDQDNMQVVGLRFTDITIPKDFKIKDAWVRFDVDEIKGGTYPVFLQIHGELSPNAATFSSDDFDITSRPKTKASVWWQVLPWTAKHEHGPNQTTSNIAAIIQEIVNQDGWVSGNALVLTFTPDWIVSLGVRCAESFEGAEGNIDRIPTLTVIPEPATIALLGLGGLALLGVRRKKR